LALHKHEHIRNTTDHFIRKDDVFNMMNHDVFDIAFFDGRARTAFMILDRRTFVVAVNLPRPARAALSDHERPA
jgi:hypothetical protein